MPFYTVFRVVSHVLRGTLSNNIFHSSRLVRKWKYILTSKIWTVALIQLPKRHFVIVSVRINGAWVFDPDYGDIDAEPVGIYNISRAGFYYLDLDLANIEDAEAKIDRLVKDVEKECPYALTFGISGIGEGIVWKSRQFWSDPEFWFKSKGDEFMVKAAKEPGLDLEKLRASERADEFAKLVTTVNRMQQGWDFLEEMKIARDRSGTGRFLSWLVDDCMTEEGREIEEAGIDKVKLKSAICLIGRRWYRERVDSNGIRS